MIVPPSPERFDGVRDFASHLGAALSASLRVTHITTAEDAAPPPGAERLAAWSALDARGDRPDAIFVNYAPQAWMRRDRRALLARLAALRDGGTRVVIIIHEYQVDPAPSVARVTARFLFRRLARAFAARADALVTTHEFVAGLARADGLERLCPMTMIPVGSNLRDPGAPALRAGPARIVMFGQPAGMQAAMTAAIARMAAARGVPLVWICRREDEARAWMRASGIAPEAMSLAVGLDNDAASRELSRATVGVAPIIDGVSTRRTSVAALLQHGLPVAGSDGRATGALFRGSAAFLLAPVGDGAAAAASVETLLDDPPLADRTAAAARDLFDAHLAWPRIASAYVRLVS